LREIAVKVCGITTVEDALACCAAGATVIGLNFAMGPRKISIGDGVTIARAVPGLAKIVGVFVDADPQEVLRAAELCNLDYVQLHGSEGREYMERLDGLRIIKACRPAPSARSGYPCRSIRMEQTGVLHRTKPDEFDRLVEDLLDIALVPNVAYLLIDAYVPGVYGGTGVEADWSVAAAVGSAMTRCGLRTPGESFTGLAIAGGLGPGNVGHCVEVVQPDMVDLNSLVEASPGRKNPGRVASAVAEVLRTQATLYERNGECELQYNTTGGDELGR